MAKIAVELERALARRAVNGTPGQTNVHLLAEDVGWKVEDVICTSGPRDRPFEEQHAGFTIAVVAAGSFQYRGATAHGSGRELMTPGSILLGNAGECFECGHDHGAGDRCISFWYAPEYFERLAADAGVRGRSLDFRIVRLPPLRALSPLVARACAGVTGSASTSVEVPWEEVSVQLAAQAIELASGLFPEPLGAPPAAVARVTRTVRVIEHSPDARLTLTSLAREARLSPYHFLRTFQRVTGMTPHRYIQRTRLREAATRLGVESARIIDIALDCGFGDLSNFNHAFRSEFGISPRGYRLRTASRNSSHRNRRSP
ncbi:MAG TPA: AraC family transcriptional regulator [Blastocatellia bacterium]|nr:AraC family transcriptional regulator [Blastocatellia bacterium]